MSARKNHQSGSSNRQWLVARYPDNNEALSNDLFTWIEEPVLAPQEGEFLVRTLYLAPGPAQRGYLTPGHSSFLETVPLGEVMRGRGIGQIVQSQHPDYQVGDYFVGSLGWQDYSLQHPRGKDFIFSTKKIRSPIKPCSSELGILGQAGATAYFGLQEAGKLHAGDNVLISAAAGGVGSAAGQIAKIKGAGKVVGITSSTKKCAWLINELGFDAAINYRTENVAQRITELFPNGIDVFFDNVGGEILNIALAHLAMHARVAICGFMATDYVNEQQAGPINYRNIVYKRACINGFVVFDYWERFPEAEQLLRSWYQDGQLKLTEDVIDGLENMPQAVAGLFAGDNKGVRICKIAPDP